MVTASPARTVLADRIRTLLVEALHLDGLDPFAIDLDSPLFGDGLGLDSVDALELVVALEREFGIAIPSTEVDDESFGSVAKVVSLVERLERSRTEQGGRG
ncbi:MAG: acyl carrier protein [Holophagales bacterium]|nr:MAG: acyl carrier protein [Holophagales bacterium]